MMDSFCDEYLKEVANFPDTDVKIVKAQARALKYTKQGESKNAKAKFDFGGTITKQGELSFYCTLWKPSRVPGTSQLESNLFDFAYASVKSNFGFQLAQDITIEQRNHKIFFGLFGSWNTT